MQRRRSSRSEAQRRLKGGEGKTTKGEGEHGGWLEEGHGEDDQEGQRLSKRKSLTVTMRSQNTQLEKKVESRKG